MKKIYLLFFTALISVALWSQTKTWKGGNGSWIQASSWIPSVVPVANDSIIFNDGATGIITNVPAIILKRITVTANTSITLQGSSGTKLITLDNAAQATGLFIDTGSSLTMGTNINITLDKVKAKIGGLLVITNNRTYDTEKGNSETSVTGTIDNKGEIKSKEKDLLFASESSYIHSQNGGTIPDATWDKNSNCLITGVINSMPAGIKKGLHFGNFEWNNPAQIPFPINTMPSFNGNLEHIDGNFIIQNTGTGSVFMSNSGNYDATVGGNYIQTGGILVLNQAGGKGTMMIKGNFNMSGGTIARNNSIAGDFSAIKFIGGSQSISKTGGIISGKIDFSVEPNSIVYMGTSVLDGSATTFKLNKGAKIITSHPDGLNSSGALGSIQTSIRSFEEEADYEFRGASTGVFNTGSSTNTTPSLVNNLTINNASGSVLLSKPITVANGPGVNRLFLQNGPLITSSINILTLNDQVMATGVPGLQQNNYNNTSFVDGPLRKVGNDAFVFPVGKVGTGLRKIGITEPVGGQNTITAFTAVFIRQNPQTISNSLVSSLARISACEYWTLDRTSTNQVRVILSWDNNSGCPGQYVTDISTLRVARYGGGMWQNDGNLGTSSASGSNSSGTITSNQLVTSFSPFALASSSAITNPLPVNFADVKAFEKNAGVQIEWSNLTEKDVLTYTVERSSNGRDYTSVSMQLPSGNQNDKASYMAFDATPFPGINYYRIKTEETSGKIVYSKILSINKNNLAGGLTLYPNPVTGHQVTISLTNLKRGLYSLRLVSSTGQDLYKQTITNFSSYMSQAISLPPSVKPGVYNLIITGNDYRESKMLIIR